MTEDDTFNRLRRMPFENLKAEYKNRYLTFGTPNTQELDWWLRARGWTMQEVLEFS